MDRSGFILFEIIIVLGLIALIIGGFYFKNNLQGQKNILEIGTSAEKKISDIQREIQNQNRSSSSEENIINQLSK